MQRVAVFALSDPHLSLGTPGKEMDRFGAQWVRHADKMAAAILLQSYLDAMAQ